MPKRHVLPINAACMENSKGDVSILFGSENSGRTTLSLTADRFIGDSSHCWTDTGVFNIDGALLTKANFITPEKDHDLYEAIKFGALVENGEFYDDTRDTNYDDTTITENTMVSFPLHHLRNAKTPAMTGHPHHVIFLANDTMGVLPPVAKLTPEQAFYHYLNGYSPNTVHEHGIESANVRFRACFGERFLAYHPSKYLRLFEKKT
jgi:phosphoenolpyruvate carboxykinase (ATP)